MVPIIGTDHWLCEKQCGWFQFFSIRICCAKVLALNLDCLSHHNNEKHRKMTKI